VLFVDTEGYQVIKLIADIGVSNYYFYRYFKIKRKCHTSNELLRLHGHISTKDHPISIKFGTQNMQIWNSVTVT